MHYAGYGRPLDHPVEAVLSAVDGRTLLRAVEMTQMGTPEEAVAIADSYDALFGLTRMLLQ